MIEMLPKHDYYKSMNRITLYHGSERIINNPIYGNGEKHNDYGLAFYTTTNIEMAKEWANRKTSNGFINKYKFDGRDLSVYDLREKNVLTWIAVLMHNRDIEPSVKELYRKRFLFLEEHFYPKEIEEYDVIIGYRADDAYFKFPMFFIQNELSIERMEEIYKLGNLGTQIALKSEKAFSKIKFLGFDKVDSIYYEKYRMRKNAADKRFEEIRIEEINNFHNTKIEDLMKLYDKR